MQLRPHLPLSVSQGGCRRLPVAQKVRHMAQPTSDDTHSVERQPPSEGMASKSALVLVRSAPRLALPRRCALLLLLPPVPLQLSVCAVYLPAALGQGRQSVMEWGKPGYTLLNATGHALSCRHFPTHPARCPCLRCRTP